MNWLDKLRNQPEYIRKIILWTTVIIIGIGLAFISIRGFSKRVKEFKKEEFFEQINLPDFEEELKGLPKIEVPELSEEELKQLEAEIEKLKQEQEEN